MPWRTATVLDERARFVLEAEHTVLSFAELCRRYSISRPTGYKWLRRYQAEGLAGLEDRSHRPNSCPHATPDHVVRRILELRRRRGWGARKLRVVLERELGWAPAADTVHRILQRNGEVEPRRKPRRTRTHPGMPATPDERPNAVWTADFKGQFKTLDGVYCYPLTVQDHASRFLLDCKGMDGLDMDAVIRRFDRLFDRRGLPEAIRTDNGHPFASSTALGRLSRLSVHWVKLGIRPERIEPGKPQQNGRHERMHRTLKARTARPPAPNRRAQQRRFDRFRRVFNHERPHEALGQAVPAEAYTASDRPRPTAPIELVHPVHLEVRRVSQDATLRWKNRKVAVSHLLKREIVGLEEIDDDVWSVYFGPVHLGWLDERDGRIMDRLGDDRRH